MQQSDGTLLTRFSAERDEAAFSELTRRYLALIFHAALRRTGNRQIAEEVSQNVLCALSRKSRALARHPERLPAWLHRATMFESSKAMRSESSSQRRKGLQHPDAIPATGSSESAWSAVLPHLDLALDRLPDGDRTLLLQHYYEGKNFNVLAALHASPAATVQKRCRRALDKLAGLLRGKNLAITATALAAGFGTEFAKAAPPALLKSAAAHALSSSYSTTQLTLYMAAKSKAVIPLALLFALVPLISQQAAISETSRHNKDLRLQLFSDGSPSNRSRASRQITTTNRGSSSGRVTITALSRAHDDARSGSSIKDMDFKEMIAALTPDELTSLIPEAIHLPEFRTKRADLLQSLILSLAKSDPEQAVKITLTADPRGEIAMFAGVTTAFSAWTLRDPDAGLAFFQELHDSTDFNPVTGEGTAWNAKINTLLTELVKSLVAADSPHARDAILMAPERLRSETLLNSIGFASANWGRYDSEIPPASSARNLANFLPLIREFTLETERVGVFQTIVFRVNSFSKDGDRILGEFADRSDLLPTERVILAESYARSKIGTDYESLPNPDHAAFETAARQWLEQHIPDEAAAIFETVRNAKYQKHMEQTRMRLEMMAEDPEVTDSYLIEQLGPRYYGELLPQALEQAARIKDPTKRSEVMLRLQHP